MFTRSKGKVNVENVKISSHYSLYFNNHQNQTIDYNEHNHDNDRVKGFVDLLANINTRYHSVKFK